MRVLCVLIVSLWLLTGCGAPPASGPRKLSPAAENRLLGERYLRENAGKPGVVVLPSGLQYKVVKVGAGPRPTANDVVRVHYRGAFIDGREFETSRDFGDKPAVIPLSRSLRGWQEGVALMPAGSIWEFTIPSQLAYGLGGSPAPRPGDPPTVGSNQCLVFTIELIGIDERPAPPAARPDAGR